MYRCRPVCKPYPLIATSVLSLLIAACGDRPAPAADAEIAYKLPDGRTITARDGRRTSSFGRFEPVASPRSPLRLADCVRTAPDAAVRLRCTVTGGEPGTALAADRFSLRAVDGLKIVGSAELAADGTTLVLNGDAGVANALVYYGGRPVVRVTPAGAVEKTRHTAPR